jgi:hypothetical protein
MGVSILNDELLESFENVLAIKTMLEKELNQVDGNKSHLDKLVPEGMKGKYSTTMKKALEFKGRILRDAYKAGVISLVATFERVAFSKYRTASGDMISYIEKAKDLSIEYYIVKDRFINSSLNWLSDLMRLMEGKINTILYEKLAEIKEQRNLYAHGSLDTVATINEYPLEEIAETLDKVLLEIEKRS